jgi:hypothetical protein
MGGVDAFGRARFVELLPLVVVMDAELSVLVVCKDRGTLL